MSEKIYTEIDKIQHVRKTKEHLTPVKENDEDRYVYQYRSLENFWKIIESDSFWATNARFSNDYKEQQLGKQKIREIIGKENMEGTHGDCYIVCFCDEDDKLSQWRGYAEEGVSIGFDFRNIRPFCIEKDDGFQCIYNSCYKVVYVDEEKEKLQLIDSFKISGNLDKSNILYLKRHAPDIIPYIKHSGFEEEAESRLIFSDNDADLSQCIRYRNINGIKVPYIVIKAKNGKKEEKCVIRLQIKEKYTRDLKNKLLREFKKEGISDVQIINCFDENEEETDDMLCYGCTVRHGYIRRNAQDSRTRCAYHKSAVDGFYGNAFNEIYLSDAQNQEEVCNFLHKFISDNEEYKEVKIWCEGHLPIRKITVGSLKGQETVIESIKHYCKNNYWLRSVEVSWSKIPYRSKLI